MFLVRYEQTKDALAILNVLERILVPLTEASFVDALCQSGDLVISVARSLRRQDCRAVLPSRFAVSSVDGPASRKRGKS